MNLLFQKFQLVVSLLLITVTSADFSPSFKEFLTDKYGDISDLARLDLSEQASFGGGDHVAKEKTRFSPVVFVHGYTAYAGNFSGLLNIFRENGYNDTELYATTYGFKSKSNISGFLTDVERISCEYIKNQRKLIQAVHEFTAQPVNIIAPSMGSAVSRKAILGGICVDTKEDLGEPLTAIIRHFVSICGANQGGIHICNGGVHANLSICNQNAGLKCGSDYLNDINSKTRYEGQKAFVIQSKKDEIVGFEICGKNAMEFEGAEKFTNGQWSHLQTYHQSYYLQFLRVYEKDS